MSSIDFSKIRKRATDYEAVWKALEAWDEGRDPDKPIVVLDLIQLLHEKIAPVVLLDAINKMLDNGLVQKTYRVVDPAMKTLLPEAYTDLSEVPDEVQNNWDQWIKVEPHTIRMVLSPL